MIVRIQNIALIVVAVVGPIVAHASSVTYEFTGIVENGSGYGLPSGSTVSGTFTFDLDNATSVAGSTSGSPWNFIGPNVFSTTVYSGTNLLYTSLPGSSTYTSSVGAENGQYSANEAAYNSTLTYGAGSSLNGPSGGLGTAWYLNGLPVPGSGPVPGGGPYYASGYIVQDFFNGPATNNPVDLIAQDTLSFGIASLSAQPSPVPLPAAAWLMLSGLGGLGALARKNAR